MPMHESSCTQDPSFFVVSLLCCQLVSLSHDCLPCLDVRTLWLKSESSRIPWSSSCFMRTVSVASDLFDFSIHFMSFLIVSLIFLLFLLPDTFNFLNVVDTYPAYFRWGPWHPGRERSSHRPCTQKWVATTRAWTQIVPNRRMDINREPTRQERPTIFEEKELPFFVSECPFFGGPIFFCVFVRRSPLDQ